ncbi:DNA polymerase III subunit beta family protein [Streptomyces chartreusis]|uniref:DNA polymerase III subunit beta family protein n=1 Tax=Streptomyces chartreusis TaxID=1969 RepID=UPI00382ED046
MIEVRYICVVGKVRGRPPEHRRLTHSQEASMPQVTQNTKVEKQTEKQPVKPTAHFAAPHAEIIEALSFAEFGVFESRTVPNQAGVFIETRRNDVTFSSFNFDTAVQVTMPAETPVAQGNSLLDFNELKKALAAMVAGETKTVAARMPVALAGDLLTTEHLSVPITALDIHEYVHAPEPAPMLAELDAQAFLAQLNRVLPAAGRDDTLPALTGIQLTLAGETLTLAATDRYRFAVADVPAPATNKPLEKPITTLIPAGILGTLAKRFRTHEGTVGIGMVTTDTDVPRATFSLGTATITVRSIHGSLPPHEKLFPKTRKASVRIDRATAVRAAKKCHALVKAKGDKHSPVCLTWADDGTLTLAPRVGEASDQARIKGMTIPSAITHGGADAVRDTHLSLNPAFLLDALATFTNDTITLHVQETTQGQATKPVLLTTVPSMRGDSYRHLLMPIRLS